MANERRYMLLAGITLTQKHADTLHCTFFGQCPLVSSIYTAQTPLYWFMSTSLITEVNNTLKHVSVRYLRVWVCIIC